MTYVQQLVYCELLARCCRMFSTLSCDEINQTLLRLGLNSSESCFFRAEAQPASEAPPGARKRYRSPRLGSPTCNRGGMTSAPTDEHRDARTRPLRVYSMPLTKSQDSHNLCPCCQTPTVSDVKQQLCVQGRALGGQPAKHMPILSAPNACEHKIVICMQRRTFSGQLCKRQLCNYPNTLGTTGWRGLAARSTPSVHTPTCTLVAGAPTPASEASQTACCASLRRLCDATPAPGAGASAPVSSRGSSLATSRIPVDTPMIINHYVLQQGRHGDGVNSRR